MSRHALVAALAVAACGKSASQRPAATPPEDAIARAARAPTPVPAGYVEANERTLREGRAALALFQGGKLAELHAQFTPELAEVATEKVLADAHAQLKSAAPPSPDDEVVFLVPGARVYVADLTVGPQAIVAQLTFDADDRLSGLSFSPHPALPPDPHAKRPLQAKLRLPFDGQWWVFWGGDTVTRNYHVAAPDQRHAYDILMWKDGATHAGDGKKNEDYYCWGQPIVAPADATVIAVENGAPDNPPGTMDPKNKAGNHVVLDLGNREFALIAHMQQGSVTVKVGDKVTRGQRLGLTGNSGNTSEPHVHFHVQDGPVLFEGHGLPVVFDDVCVDGKPAAPASPVHGQFIEHCG